MVLTESPAVSAGMPDGSEDGGSEAVNRSSELTDDVLHLVLPWLPAHEAVRTSDDLRAPCASPTAARRRTGR
jgi:hypothetical protein